METTNIRLLGGWVAGVRQRAGTPSAARRAVTQHTTLYRRCRTFRSNHAGIAVSLPSRHCPPSRHYCNDYTSAQDHTETKRFAGSCTTDCRTCSLNVSSRIFAHVLSHVLPIVPLTLWSPALFFGREGSRGIIRRRSPSCRRSLPPAHLSSARPPAPLRSPTRASSVPAERVLGVGRPDSN